MSARHDVVSHVRTLKLVQGTRNGDDPDLLDNVDTQGFRGVAICMGMGNNASLTTTNSMSFELFHSDDSSDWENVSRDDVEFGHGAVPGTFNANRSEIWRRTSNPTHNPTATVGYMGGKRYLRVGAHERGTVGQGVAMRVAVVGVGPRASMK